MLYFFIVASSKKTVNKTKMYFITEEKWAFGKQTQKFHAEVTFSNILFTSRIIALLEGKLHSDMLG